MDKRIVFVISLVIIIAGAVTYVVLNKPTISAEKQTMAGQQSEPSPAQTPPPASPQPASGAYIAYGPDVIARTTGTKVLFFHAPWCPQCRMLDTDITKNGVPAGMTIIKVDYDSNQALRQQYGITIQTTFVRVDDSGNLIKKYVAYNEPNLAAVIKGIQ